MKEYLLSVDKFSKPKVIEGKDAVYTLLQRLLLLTPGTIQIHPEMGVGIVTRWRFIDMDNLSLLESEISNQIMTYLPEFQGAEVKITPADVDRKTIIIKITIENTLYAFQANDKVLTIADL